MEDYGNLLAAAGVFVASHVVLAADGLKRPVEERLGVLPVQGLYALVALLTFSWLIAAYLDAPREYLWIAPTWIRHSPMGVMVLCSLLLVAGYTSRNPTAVGFDRFVKIGDGPRGVFRVTRHPVLSALALWALVHIPASGQISAMILQAGIGFLAVAGMVHIDARKAARLGAAWNDYAAATSRTPFLAILQGRQRLVLPEIGWLRLAAGLAFYGALLVLHVRVIGVSPLPMPYD